MEIQRDVILSDLTTIKIGGKAQFFAVCSTISELKEAIGFARENNLKIHILGGGSNIVFPDEILMGLVLKVEINGIEFREFKQGFLIARVGAGENWDSFVELCVEKKLSGVECLSGIPGNVGATPIQNVGAYGQDASETIFKVFVVETSTGKEKVFSKEECEFGYRTSIFKTRDKGKYIVTYVEYILEKNGKPKIAYPELKKEIKESDSLLSVREAVLVLRKKKSMVLDSNDPNTKSSGSFFLNPTITKDGFEKLKNRTNLDIPNFPAEDGKVKIPAAWLIEHSGLEKGYSKNGIGISTKHALALVNKGGGMKDLVAFANEIQKTVFEKFGIKLEKEPEVIEE